jgi:hypothetical protein
MAIGRNNLPTVADGIRDEHPISSHSLYPPVGIRPKDWSLVVPSTCQHRSQTANSLGSLDQTATPKVDFLITSVHCSAKFSKTQESILIPLWDPANSSNSIYWRPLFFQQLIDRYPPNLLDFLITSVHCSTKFSTTQESILIRWDPANSSSVFPDTCFSFNDRSLSSKFAGLFDNICALFHKPLTTQELILIP